MALTYHHGFDKVIEVVIYPETQQLCLGIIWPGGTIVVIGVFFDQEFNLVLGDVFFRNISRHINNFLPMFNRICAKPFA